MQTVEKSVGPVAALQATAARPFEDAIAMPPEVYTSENFRTRELERVFRHDWVCVGRASALSKPGDYLTYDLAGQPVAVIRDRRDALPFSHTAKSTLPQLSLSLIRQILSQSATT